MSGIPAFLCFNWNVLSFGLLKMSPWDLETFFFLLFSEWVQTTDVTSSQMIHTQPLCILYILCPPAKDRIHVIPDKLLHRGYSGQERPCYSELHTLPRARSASAVLLDCRIHVPLRRSSVWRDFLFLWERRHKNRLMKKMGKYFRWVTYIDISSTSSHCLWIIFYLCWNRDRMFIYSTYT